VRPERAQALVDPLADHRRACASENTMSARLSGELLERSNNRGQRGEEGEDTHRNGRSEPRVQATTLVSASVGFRRLERVNSLL